MKARLASAGSDVKYFAIKSTLNCLEVPASNRLRDPTKTPLLAKPARSGAPGLICTELYLLTTRTTKLSGSIGGRGWGLSAVAAGRGPKFAVTV